MPTDFQDLMGGLQATRWFPSIFNVFASKHPELTFLGEKKKRKPTSTAVITHYVSATYYLGNFLLPGLPHIFRTFSIQLGLFPASRCRIIASKRRGMWNRGTWRHRNCPRSIPTFPVWWSEQCPGQQKVTSTPFIWKHGMLWNTINTTLKSLKPLSSSQSLPTIVQATSF